MAARKRVLVVDDEPGVVATLSEALRMNGFSVVTARDGIEALEASERYQPDGMLLDVMMPGENGYRVARAIKERERGPGDGPVPKILLVTGRRMDEDPEREEMFLRFSMADGVLYKPFRLSEVVDQIKTLLG